MVAKLTMPSAVKVSYLDKAPQVYGSAYLSDNDIYCGDARTLLARVRPNAVALSFWSPPYFVGKSYEKDMSFEDWQSL